MREVNEPMSARRVRYTVLAAIVFLHLTAVPVAALATYYGYAPNPDYLPRFAPKDAIWILIANAQTSLLAIYLVFGPNRFYIRMALFFSGMAIVLLSVLSVDWVHAAAHGFLMRLDWTRVARETSTWLHLPPIVTVLVTFPLRWSLGAIQLKPAVAFNRYSILDLVVTTTFVAAILAWLRLFVVRYDLSSLVVPTVVSIACTVCCLLCALTCRWSSLGAVGLAVSIVTHRLYWLGHTLYGESVGWFELILSWLIVLATLACFRLMGYRLGRPVRPEQQDVTTEDNPVTLPQISSGT